MTDRGQNKFVHLHGFAARLYALLTSIESIQRQQDPFVGGAISG